MTGLKEALDSAAAPNVSPPGGMDEHDVQEDGRRSKVLEDEVRMKNKHIHQLIKDIDDVSSLKSLAIKSSLEKRIMLPVVALPESH